MADGTRRPRQTDPAVTQLAQLLPQLRTVREFGSLSLTKKYQLTLPKQARDLAGVESLVYVWGLPELRMLMMVGQPQDPANHLNFLVNSG